MSSLSATAATAPLSAKEVNHLRSLARSPNGHQPSPSANGESADTSQGKLKTVLGVTDQRDQHRFFPVRIFRPDAQSAPVQGPNDEFLRNVKACLKPRGTIAMSVPNRERWLTGPDVLDYPPNHFLRWNAAALRKFLGAQGFDVVSVREQPAGLRHTAQMINMALRTGMIQNEARGGPASFRDVMQMAPEQAEVVLRAKPTGRQRLLQALGRLKHAACFPLALVAWPYVRALGYRGTYLYCLARLRD